MTESLLLSQLFSTMIRIMSANCLFYYSQALRYMIRNTTLPQRVRAQAQLQLSQMHPYTRPTQIKNRCVASGTARAVFRDFRINRVSHYKGSQGSYLNVADQAFYSSNSVCKRFRVNFQVSRRQVGKLEAGNVLENNVNMKNLGWLGRTVAFSSSLHLEPV